MIVPGPRQPFAVAATYAEVRAMDGRPLKRWRGDWYTYRGVCWVQVGDADVRAELVAWLTGEETRTRGTGGTLIPWVPSRDNDILNVLAMLGDICHRESGKDAARGIFLSNLWVDEKLIPNDYSPAVWNTTAASYEWKISAECPQTLTWLESILSGEDIELLRQWCGYLVSKRTDLQKMLVLIGPPRSGKGTLLWMMEELLGPGSAASVASLGELTRTFGLEPLLGASLAVMPDVRWSSKDAADAVPEILSITGCDSRDVNRKNQKAWRGRLGVRFVAASNDTPSLADASGALAGRMLTITMHLSFLGKEDPGLKDVIRTEMPGVLQWALGGLKDLTAVGRFVEPVSSVEAGKEAREASNPVYLFAEDSCVLGPHAIVPLDVLYESYDQWCQKNGYSKLPSSILVRQLRNTFRGKVQSVRKRPGPGLPQRRYVLGVTVRGLEQYTPDNEPLYVM